MTRRVGGVVAACLVLGLTTGCGGGPGPAPEPAPDAPAATSTLPPAEGGPLADLPECPAPPAAAGGEEVPDLVVPEGTVVTGVEDLGELVSATGWVALTPIQVRRFYADAPGLELFTLEDELYEAEILYGTGSSRVFVRAQAQCRQGSVLNVFVGPADGEGLPPLSGG